MGPADGTLIDIASNIMHLRQPEIPYCEGEMMRLASITMGGGGNDASGASGASVASSRNSLVCHVRYR